MMSEQSAPLADVEVSAVDAEDSVTEVQDGVQLVDIPAARVMTIE